MFFPKKGKAMLRDKAMPISQDEMTDYRGLPVNPHNQYVLEYNKAEIKHGKRVAYIKKCSEHGKSLLKLHDKMSDKEILFWTSQNDKDASKRNEAINDFITKIAATQNEEFFKRSGKDYIIVQGIFGTEDETTIEMLIYYSDLFINSEK